MDKEIRQKIQARREQNTTRESVSSELSAFRDTLSKKNRRSWKGSKLDRHSKYIMLLREEGATLFEIQQLLQIHRRCKADVSTISRWLNKA